MADYSGLATQLTPLVVELIEEYRHRDDVLTEAEVEQRLTAKLAENDTKLDAWLNSHKSN